MDALKQQFGAEIRTDRGREIAHVPREKIIEALTHLREQEGFDCLLDLTAVDLEGYPDPAPGRFAVVYELYSFAKNARCRVKTFLPADDPRLRSATAVWPGAGWAEREVFDLMGIRFEGHPDLRRILLPEGFEHHPLRKEYPVQGRGERDGFERYYR